MIGLEKVFFVSVFAAAAIACPAVLATALAEEHVPKDVNPLPDDMVALQGLWECRERRPEGDFRIVKLIEGNAETYRVYRNGEQTLEHRADIVVNQEGPVKVFRWHNAKALIGPAAGRDVPNGGYVYRLNENEWICVFGILAGETGSTFAMRFRRIPPGAEQAPAEGAPPAESNPAPGDAEQPSPK